MKQLFFTLTVSLLVLAGCSLGVSKYNDAVLDGISHLNTGKPEKALEDFNRAIKIKLTINRVFSNAFLATIRISKKVSANIWSF